jgi:hypothetical protein
MVVKRTTTPWDQTLFSLLQPLSILLSTRKDDGNRCPPPCAVPVKVAAKPVLLLRPAASLTVLIEPQPARPKGPNSRQELPCGALLLQIVTVAFVLHIECLGGTKKAYADPPSAPGCCTPHPTEARGRHS